MRWIVLLSILFFVNVSSQTNNYYFGNLHSHTGFSDGSKDSISSGVTKPDGAFTYAKISNDFDFLGVSEHNHYSTSKNPGFKLPLYQQGLLMADAANNEGSFLALFGMEYGISSSNNGHVVIYGFNQLIGWETNVGGSSGNNYDIFNVKNDYAGLFRKVKNNPNAFCYLAHPYWTDFTLDGTNATALAFSPYNQEFDSAIVGMPLRSGNAFSTFNNYSDYSTGDYFDYYKNLLHLGYHLGIGYDHDNHNTNFGRGNAGRLVIIAPVLTRANLYKAMKEMHFYGSDDSNAKIGFSVNGKIMGSVFTTTNVPSINLIHSDGDAEKADTIRLWKGHKGSSGIWAEVIKMELNSNVLSYTDRDVQPGIEYYYFADIRQADGQWIVTSPIWYTGEGALVVREAESFVFNFFPNPVSKQLRIQFTDISTKEIEIVDFLGRSVLSARTEDRELLLDMQSLEAGVYILRVASGNHTGSNRIILR